jgi:hypothetical protein
MNDLKKIIYCGFFFLFPLLSPAQKQKTAPVIINGINTTATDTTRKVCISNLEVSGTKKTKVYIVYREIQFKKGDSLLVSSLQKELEQARHQVYNTTLFNEVSFILTAVDSVNVNINVQLVERWYLYPVPHFQLVDRNFNEWYKTFNASFDRVNYGVKFVHYNLSGRRDQLRIYLINGYTRNISFAYSNPYSNRALTQGFSVNGGYSQNRETPYKTDSSNKILLHKETAFARKSIYGGIGFSIRKGLFKRHSFTVTYTYLKVNDTITKLNQLQYANVNNIAYPLTGNTAFLSIQKRGLGFTGGINMLTLEAGFFKYISLGKNWYSSFYVDGRLRLPFEQPYINQRGLGYGENYLRGQEYYVIDGVATAILKSTLKKKVVTFNIPFRLFPKYFTKIPFTFFAKTYADVGYAYNKKTTYTYLNNRLLYTGGFGIDMLTLYDLNFRFEYSFNQLGQNGLFLHSRLGF